MQLMRKKTLILNVIAQQLEKPILNQRIIVIPAVIGEHSSKYFVLLIFLVDFQRNV